MSRSSSSSTSPKPHILENSEHYKGLTFQRGSRSNTPSIKKEILKSNPAEHPEFIGKCVSFMSPSNGRIIGMIMDAQDEKYTGVTVKTDSKVEEIPFNSKSFKTIKLIRCPSAGGKNYGSLKHENKNKNKNKKTRTRTRHRRRR